MKSLSVATPTPPITRSTVESTVFGKVRDRLNRVGQEIRARYDRGFVAFSERRAWEKERRSAAATIAAPVESRVLGFLLPIKSGNALPLFEGFYQLQGEKLVAVSPAEELENRIRVEPDLFQVLAKVDKGVARRFFTNEVVTLGGHVFILKLLEESYRIKTVVSTKGAGK